MLSESYHVARFTRFKKKKKKKRNGGSKNGRVKPFYSPMRCAWEGQISGPKDGTI